MEISVVIPAYNAAHTLAEAVESVLDQTFPPAEIAVVDDGSTDGTAAIMRRYMGRVRYIRTAHRGLPAATRNRGIVETHAELVAFLDADDWWYPRHLEQAANALRRSPDAGLCYGNFDQVDERGGHIRRVRVKRVNGSGYRALLLYDFICTSTTVVRRACLDHLGLFLKWGDLAGWEDWELWLRIARHYPLVHVHDSLVAYRVHPGSISQSRTDRWPQSLRALQKIILEQVDASDKARVIGWHDFMYARFCLRHGDEDGARALLTKSLRGYPAVDRRLIFWLLTVGKWVDWLPDRVRQRLGMRARATTSLMT